MYLIGEITKQERKLRIINTLTRTILKMKVCEEDTIYDIQTKYLHFNSHFGSYTWKKYGPNVYCISNQNLSSSSLFIVFFKFKHNCSGFLTLNNTLTENGLFFNLSDPVDTIWLYFNDDFTVG
jgi:hypothetical protein